MKSKEGVQFISRLALLRGSAYEVKLPSLIKLSSTMVVRSVRIDPTNLELSS